MIQTTFLKSLHLKCVTLKTHLNKASRYLYKIHFLLVRLCPRCYRSVGLFNVQLGEFKA